MAAFKPGDRVEWVSGAHGSTTRKEGTVIGLIPPKERPVGLFPEVFGSISPGQNKVNMQGRDASTAIRYLVRVDRMGTKGELPPWYYAPRVSALVLMEDKEPV